MKEPMMTNYSSLQDAINNLFGQETRIESSVRVGGGDINEAHCLFMNNGKKLFMKSNRKENARFFSTEINGLSALRSTHTIRIPRVYGCGTDNQKAFLLMEYIQEETMDETYWKRFATQLAHMHQADCSQWCSGGYGFTEDNYIGASVQCNQPDRSWISFFRHQRLKPQIKTSFAYFDERQKKDLHVLLDHLDHYLIEPEYPSLLHGDLWQGNIMASAGSEPWLIDPACYVGHYEADLAMTELFGRFPSVFYDTYQSVCPKQPGYPKRREIYNLYHLLNHLNLFGPSYLSSVLNSLYRILSD
ncbi:MAG: fructosamine kinase family protein [Erysipelotrichaceae bacterium]|nr:fructosamine kinase family protein [Erysipelotrichaceae bacterium]